jgi:ribonuclease HII
LFTSKYLKEETRTVPTSSLNINKGKLGLTTTINVSSEKVSKVMDNTEEEFSKQICILVDGPSFKTELPFHYQTIVNGDALSLSIACASIVAKVTRDRILETYDKVFPQYGFRNHKGYPTRAHKLAIQQHGLSLIHRKTFHHAL